MSAVSDASEYPYTWRQFLGTANRLHDAIRYSKKFTLAKCFEKHWVGNTALDFTRPAPVLDNLEDANTLIARLWTENQVKLKNVQLLTAKANLSSDNSSLPPSQDSIANKAKRYLNREHKPSGKKQGGQPRHKGFWRTLRPIEEVDEIVACTVPVCCRKCKGTLGSASIVRRK